MAIQDILSTNKHRRYPFVEDSDTGYLPDWALLDFRLVDVDFSGEDARVVCDRVLFDGSTYTLVFEYSKDETKNTFDIKIEAGSDIAIGSVAITKDCTVKFATYGGGTEYTGSSDSFDQSISAPILKSRLVLLDKRLFVKSAGGCTGVVHVVDGHNTEAKIVNGRIVITVGSGLGKGADCNVPEDAFDCTKALLFMNGQHADTNGNINISGGSGVTVQTGRMAYVNGSMVPAVTIRADPAIGGLY